MTLNANFAGQIERAETETNAEKRDMLVFFACVFALVATIVVTGLTVGLSGIGMIAIAEAGAMIGLCILLTAG
jgi:hypothetical protein